MANIISVLGSSNKISDSVAAVNIACALKGLTKGRVLLFDLNNTEVSHCELLLEYYPEKKLGSVIDVMDKLDEDIIKGYLPIHEKTGISVLSGYVNGALDIKAGDIQMLIKLFSNVYDCIVINTNKNNKEFLESVLDLSNSIVSFIDPEVLSLREIKEYIDLFKSWHLHLDMVNFVRVNTGAKYALTQGQV